MTTVTISPKFQVVIPKPVREAFNLKTGMKLAVIPYNGRIELIPIKGIKKLEGSFKNTKVNFAREKKDRIL